MIEVKHYICEICNTEYKNKYSCQRCEKGHIKPLEIVKQKYVSIGNDASGYPVWIEVEMSNGKVVRYKR